MKTGLTLGKYAPLHRGHQHLIETALKEMDRVSVLVYDAPEVTSVPLPIRAGWIKKLYPEIEVLEAWDGPSEVGSDRAVTALHDSYLRRRLAGRKITHFYSSEFYGDHVSQALGAVDRRVDPSRSRVPVSGTLVRSDPYRYREYLDPVVYRDLVTQVVLLGAPSTGKTTLAAALAEEHRTVWVPEYGREYWEKHQVERRLTLEQLFEIGVGHRQREEAQLLSANRYLFIDTDATTTRQFSLYYHDACDERLGRLADETLQRYDVFFLCLADIPYDDTWDRSGAVFREVFQRRIEADLIARRIPYVRLGGPLHERIARVNRVLAEKPKWHS